MAQPKHEPEVRQKAKPVASIPAKANPPKPKDQKDTPARVSGDQKDAPAKAKKKPSETVAKWKEANAQKLYSTGTITITPEAKAKGEKAKRGPAMERFRLYRDGMTVAEYVEAQVKAGHNKQAGALSDVRWDVVKGLITVS